MPRRAALLVGINYINTPNELNGCYNDIVNVSQFLRSNLGYTSITMISDGNRNTAPQVIAGYTKPNRQNILAGISNLVSGLVAGDEVLFHYSGHGTLIRDTNGDEVTGYDSCLCPIDYDTAGIISDDEIRRCLINKITKGVKLYVILDCCHNGTGCDIRYKYEDYSILLANRPTMRWNTQQKALLQSKYTETQGDVFMISGSRDEQTSSDAYINNQFAGALTYAVMSTLRANNIRTYTWSSLLRDLRYFMRVNKYDQVPQLMTGKLITPASQVFTIPVISTKKTLDFSVLNNDGAINTVSSTGAAGRSITTHVNDIRKIQFYH
jgi:hypothetical protein